MGHTAKCVIETGITAISGVVPGDVHMVRLVVDIHDVPGMPQSIGLAQVTLNVNLIQQVHVSQRITLADRQTFAQGAVCGEDLVVNTGGVHITQVVLHKYSQTVVEEQGLFHIGQVIVALNAAEQHFGIFGHLAQAGRILVSRIGVGTVACSDGGDLAAGIVRAAQRLHMEPLRSLVPDDGLQVFPLGVGNVVRRDIKFCLTSGKLLIQIVHECSGYFMLVSCAVGSRLVGIALLAGEPLHSLHGRFGQFRLCFLSRCFGLGCLGLSSRFFCRLRSFRLGGRFFGFFDCGFGFFCGFRCDDDFGLVHFLSADDHAGEAGQQQHQSQQH